MHYNGIISWNCNGGGKKQQCRLCVCCVSGPSNVFFGDIFIHTKNVYYNLNPTRNDHQVKQTQKSPIYFVMQHELNMKYDKWMNPENEKWSTEVNGSSILLQCSVCMDMRYLRYLSGSHQSEPLTGIVASIQRDIGWGEQKDKLWYLAAMIFIR